MDVFELGLNYFTKGHLRVLRVVQRASGIFQEVLLFCPDRRFLNYNAMGLLTFFYILFFFYLQFLSVLKARGIMLFFRRAIIEEGKLLGIREILQKDLTCLPPDYWSQQYECYEGSIP